ncbi:MAG: radical SAM family RiPP maturation amino acid epimerase [Planctomycetaceae bacterium]|jgi:radical SAM family RiPP maturation amino acid epimerase|nr:radical SAM family RiPP maturation amino acid epimerase [Planctomycetaceae bacterium]
MLFNSFYSRNTFQKQQFDDFIRCNGEKYRRIMDEPGDTDDDYRRTVAEMKRFLEAFTGKASVRQRCKEIHEAQRVAEELGLSIDVNDFRIVWDTPFLQTYEGSLWLCAGEAVNRHRSFIQEKIEHRGQLQQELCVPKNERLRIWRRRQMNRIYSELGIGAAKANIHTPLSFELSDGCSVGCWFCGVAAKKKNSDFLYTPDNIKLWRNILEFFKDFLGNAASTGTCYYGTEPLDNPDYEKWCNEYADVLGTFPQTTTAIAMRDVERTRRLLKHSRKRGAKINRFSVLNEKTLNEIHAAFSPLELLYTELLMQNMESVSLFSHSGRAREHSEMIEKKALKSGIDQPNSPASICCISGFRINMVRKTIDLLTPCTADETHPLGEYLLATGSFESVGDIETFVKEWTNDIIVSRLMPRNLAAFRPDLTTELDTEKNLLTLKNGNGTFTYTNPLIPLLYKPLQAGNQSVYQIAENICEQNSEFSMDQVFAYLDILFQDGFLNESPEFFHTRKFEYTPQ